MKKKILALLIAVSALVSVTHINVFAADKIYSYIDTSDLSKGVTYSSYKMLMSDYTWVNAQVIRADLSNPHLALQVLSDSRGVNYLNNVKNIATQHNTLAAVNSDFFAWGKPGRGGPVGVSYLDNAMFSSPSTNGEMYSLAQDKSGNVFIDMFNYSMTLVAPNGDTHPIRGLNKADDLSGVVMYNKYWDAASLGSDSFLHELVVRDGVVQEIRFNAEPVMFDDNTYVLATLSDWDTFLIDNFQVGDPVKIDISSSVNFSNLNMAAGGGARILHNGNVPGSFSHNIAGSNPRTAAGVDQSGKIIYFVTVEGRIASSRGMTLTELGGLMKQIGAYNAINLDGGGSTTMVVRNAATGGQEVKNTPSEGSLRSIATALAIKADIPDDPDIASIAIVPDAEGVWANSHLKLSVSAANQYFVPMQIDQQNVTWAVSGVDGYIDNHIFYPKSGGIATLTASYGGLSANLQVRVLDKPVSIEYDTREISLKTGEYRNIWASARDENGYKAYIPLSDMIITTNNNTLSFTETAIVGNQPGSSVVNLALGDASINLAVSVDGAAMPKRPADRYAADSRNKTGTPLNDADKSIRFGIFGQLQEPSTLFNRLIMSRAADKINAVSDIGALLSVYTTPFVTDKTSIPVMTCSQYGSSIEGDNKIIRLDSEDSFMSMKEWSWLLSAVEAPETKNVLVMLNTGINFKASWETQLFQDVMAETAKKGHNVYVFHNGAGNTVTAKDGVRYLSVSGFTDDIKLENFLDNVSKLQYLLVDIDGKGELSYRYMPLY